jgi:hypothetical protein
VFIDFAQCLGELFQIVIGKQEDFAPDRIGRHEVVDLSRVLLAVTTDVTDPLLQVHRVPRLSETVGDLVERLTEGTKKSSGGP